jgi:short-subunit dehydrogenase
MVSQGRGKIINVSSLLAFIPSPNNAMYSASKAFVKLLTESLYLELRGTGVQVQALCPGFTRTDFHERMGFDKITFYKDKGLMKAMTPEEVVDISLQYLDKNKVICVPGGNNKLSRFLLKVLPQALIYKIASSTTHKKV